MPDAGTGGLTRRGFLGAGLALFAQDSLAGKGSIGTLRDPTALGRLVAPTKPGDDAAEIQAIEQRLACNCGCTLDVFTCRTTDFSCTYSPALHREVLALKRDGLTAQQVLDAFVAKYGEKALMAPKPRGFMNLTGYLLPSAVILAAGAALMTVIARRRVAVAGGIAPKPDSSPPPVNASAEELEGLKRALSEVDD
ncbi:MAG: cytochrome c-type biogenesis protein CcmH [Gemmatimonadales bacterium]